MSLNRGDGEIAFDDLPAADTKRLTVRKNAVMSSTVKLACCVTVWMLCMPIRQVHAGLERECKMDYEPGSYQGVHCGVQLSEMLQLLCHPYGYYSGSRPRYRRELVDPAAISTKTTSTTSTTTKNPVVKMDLPPAFKLTKSSALAYLKKKRMDRRSNNYNSGKGIICECCYNNCSTEEMVQYCNHPSVLDK